VSRDGRTVADVVLADAKLNRARPQSAKPRSAQMSQGARARPQSAVAAGSRATTAGSMDSEDRRVEYYRKQPISKSRQMWNRINPGHMNEKWESTHKAHITKYAHKNYAFKKEFHQAKTDIMEYVNDMIMMKVSVKYGFRAPS